MAPCRLSANLAPGSTSQEYPSHVPIASGHSPGPVPLYAIFSPYTGLLLSYVLSLPQVFKGLCTDHPNRSIHPVNMATPRHLLQRVPETQLLTAPNSTHPSLLGSNLASLLPPGHQGHLSSISFLLLLFSCSVVSGSFQPMDCSKPGFPVLPYLPEFANIDIH